MKTNKYKSMKQRLINYGLTGKGNLEILIKEANTFNEVEKKGLIDSFMEALLKDAKIADYYGSYEKKNIKFYFGRTYSEKCDGKVLFPYGMWIDKYSIKTEKL